MMVSDAARKPRELGDTQRVSHNSGKLLSRKIWLPKSLYTALPYFYLATGIAALLATLYISHWLWILPHYLMFSAACLHLAALVFRRRNRARKETE